MCNARVALAVVLVQRQTEPFVQSLPCEGLQTEGLYAFSDQAPPVANSCLLCVRVPGKLRVLIVNRKPEVFRRLANVDELRSVVHAVAAEPRFGSPDVELSVRRSILT